MTEYTADFTSDAEVNTLKNPELRESIKQYALEKFGARRQEDLDDLFLVGSFAEQMEPEEAEQHKKAFLAEKKKLQAEIEQTGRICNIGDVYDLALKYYGRINVVKLAETNHDVPDESARLLSEYNDLLGWYRDRGVSINQLSRGESRRWFTAEIVGDESDGPDGYRAILHRVRPLAKSQIEVNGQPAELALFKETIVSMPAIKFRTFMESSHASGEEPGEDGFAWSDRQKRMIESAIFDVPEAYDIQRINTAYFSSLLPGDDADKMYSPADPEP